ncbi:tRNA-guanine(15) transglycosylase-like protein [Cerioporus squamosus]|nr:tRNA-guanine(15) transglycosylase-like protein [Cerioporus squamosus]
MSASSLFTLSVTSGKFGPRTGSLNVDREDGTPVIRTPTPALLTATSRGVVPHFSRDNVRVTGAIQHIQLPFESFLDRNPPVLTLVGGSRPLHQFLGYETDKHVIVLTLRDSSDGRKMPPNGNDFVSAQCTRGVRKVSPSAWKSYVQKCKPDLVVALSDTPFTPPPHSQKRLTKSIERSISWLADFLRLPADSSASRPPNVLAHLVGGADPHARAEFADRLSEPIEHKDAAGLSPLNTLDDGVAGYVFDLLPLHTALRADGPRPMEPAGPADELLKVSDRQRSSSDSSSQLADLLQASLDPLSMYKPRVVNSPVSPHEILRLVRDVGVDLVDGFWAQRAADVGIAFDFRFPVPPHPSTVSTECPPPRTRECGKVDLGHNLFDARYRHDHSRVSSGFADGQSMAGFGCDDLPVCRCTACSPRSPASHLLHSSVDVQSWHDSQQPVLPSVTQPPFVRSYIHHLLHTHEMSSHALLAMHNLTVLSAFLDGIRDVLARESPQVELEKEIERFEQKYDEEMVLWDEAAAMWLDVEHARGKGRLAREREKQAVSTMGTAVVS